jgi:SPP1 family predicted phage head-tail adaptor
MRAGDLRRQIKIQQRSTAQDTLGQPVLTWTDVCTTWADIQPLSGRELELAQAINAEVNHQVTIRYRTGITAAMRVLYQGRIFNIQAVMDVDTRHKELQLMCSEGLNNG